MNRFMVALLMVFVAGCSASATAPSKGQPSAPSNAAPQPLTVTVMADGSTRVGELIVSEGDWSELVKQWHVTSAVVTGQLGTKFSDLVRVKEAIRAAGVANVSIAQPDGGS